MVITATKLPRGRAAQVGHQNGYRACLHTRSGNTKSSVIFATSCIDMLPRAKEMQRAACQLTQNRREQVVGLSECRIRHRFARLWHQ